MKPTSPAHESRFRTATTQPGTRAARRRQPVHRQRPGPPRVLLLEEQSALRSALRDLLRNRGLAVTAAPPESVDFHSFDWGWDAVVFNPEQRTLRRQRWLFGHRPPRGRTRLVALYDPETPPPSYAAHEVDATLPYPLSVSSLVDAILGDRPSRDT